MTSPVSSAAGFVPVCPAVSTTITRPGKTARSRHIAVEGLIVGAMYRGDAVHHYRVEGADGVLYLCPPHWLPRSPLTAVTDAARNAYFVRAIGEIIANWDARRGRAPQPEGAA